MLDVVVLAFSNAAAIKVMLKDRLTVKKGQRKQLISGLDVSIIDVFDLIRPAEKTHSMISDDKDHVVVLRGG